MTFVQPGTSTVAQDLDNSVHLFRLQMLIIDGGLLVLRNYIDQKLPAASTANSSLSTCLAKKRSTIMNLRKNKTITKVQYDLLFPSSGNVSTSDLDITLIVFLLRNLKCFGLNPNFNWNTKPAPGDTSVEAAICNLKWNRNEISHIRATSVIKHGTFKTLWKEIKEILLRINSFSAMPIAGLKQTIKVFKSYPLDPKIEKRVQDKIEKWRELEKAVEIDLSILKTTNKRLLEDVNVVQWKVAKLEEENKIKDKPMTEPQYLQRKQEFRENLVKFYKDKQSTIPLSPLVEEVETDLAGFYVMPDMVLVKRKSLISDKEERTPIKLTDLFTNEGEDQQEIYLSADAGFGKTSFSKYLAMTWVQTCIPDNNIECFKEDEIKALANFEFLFLILLRDSTAVCTIDGMIEQQVFSNLPPPKIMYPLEEVLRREKCLIILDGLDEWTHPDNGCPNQKEKIPHRFPRTNCIILTTTRPWKLGVSNLKMKDINKKVEIDKLSQDSTSQLEKNVIRKMSGVSDDDKLKNKTRDFRKALSDCGLKHMQTVPLLLMYMTCLWCNKIPIRDSRFEVYINIIEFLLSRMTQKHPEVIPSSEPSHSDIPEYFEKHTFCRKFYSLLTALAELAYHTLLNEKRENTLVFNESVVENYFKADDIKLSLLSGILKRSTTPTLLERKSKMSYSHKTVQEFFAAIFISSQSDGQKRVLQKCKNVQSILDMSTICEFISKMNSNMMFEILTRFKSVIDDDEETLNFRTKTGVYMFHTPLYNIQEMLLACLKEMPKCENNKLCLQDLFIKYDDTIHDEHLQRLSELDKTNMRSLAISNSPGTSKSLNEIMTSFSPSDLNNLHKLYYVGDSDNEADISVLFFPSLQTVRLEFDTWTNYEGNVYEKFDTLKNVQYLEIGYLTLSHEILEQILNFISGKKTLKELTLLTLSCKEHCRDCKRNFDLSEHSRLKTLKLSSLPSLQLNLTTPSLIDVKLGLIDLGDRSLILSRDMKNIERIKLSGIEISAEGFCDKFIKVAEHLPQSIAVKMCNLKPYMEYELVRRYISSSKSFVVTHDSCNRVPWRQEFVFQTKSK